MTFSRKEQSVSLSAPIPRPAALGDSAFVLKAGSRRYGLALLVVLACAIPYGVAFLLPAADLGVKDGRGIGQAPMHISTGWSAYSWAFSFRATVWLANPLVWLAALLMVLRLWVWAGLVGLGAFGVGFSEFVLSVVGIYHSVYLSGYWLWVVSMAGLGICGLVGAWFIPAEGQLSLRRVALRPSLVGWCGAALVIGLWGGGIRLWYVSDHGGGQPPRVPGWNMATSWSGMPFFLVPVEWVDAERRPPVEEVWRTLYTDMAADPETQAVFRRICNNADVEVKVRLFRDAAAVKAAVQEKSPPPPPVGQPSGFLELRRPENVTGQRGMGEYADCLNLRLAGSLHLYLDGLRLKEFDAAPYTDLVVVLANDHLLRKGRGYQLRRGEVPDNHGAFHMETSVDLVRGTPFDARVELDRQIDILTARRQQP